MTDDGGSLRRAIRGRAARRSGWVIVDQALSSGTNFLATVVVARSVGADSFGAFATAYVLYNLALAVVRSLVAMPLTIRVSARVEQEDEVSAAVAAAVVTGAVGGTVVGGVGLALGGELGKVVLIVGLLMPGLCLQDIWRFVFFTVARPVAAVVNDLVWAGTLIVAMAAALQWNPTVTWLTVVWAAAASVAALIGFFQCRLWPVWGAAAAYLRRHLDLGWRYAVESVVTNGSWLLATIVLGVVVGAGGIGALRGAQTLYGPWMTLQTGAAMAAIPEGARLAVRRPTALPGVLRLMSSGFAVTALLWGVALVAIPDAWGVLVLGDTWVGARELLPPVITMMVGLGVLSGGLVGLRVLAAATETLRIKLLAVAVSLVGALVGASVGGVTGGAWGIALGPWVNAAGSWVAYSRRQTSTPDRSPHPPSTGLTTENDTRREERHARG